MTVWAIVSVDVYNLETSSMNLFDLIMECARIPSFSSYEDKLHPFIEETVRQVPSARMEWVSENNIVIEVPGNRDGSVVALTAHLDKINHSGGNHLDFLEVDRTEKEITGQLDDAVGVGICLYLLQQSRNRNFSPMYLLFSEMEESVGLRNHPHLLNYNGKNLYPQIGAERIAHYLIKQGKIPSALITVDTTPLFDGERGIALYSRHWEINGLSPSEALVDKTKRLVNYFLDLNSELILKNNINDYVMYGKVLNHNHVVPCLALEPAIWPYHEIGEKVYCADVEKVASMLESFLASVGNGLLG